MTVKSFATLFFAVLVAFQLGCEKQPAAVVDPKRGEVVTAEPVWDIAITIDGQAHKMTDPRGLGIYEARPPRDGKQRPQTFELAAMHFTLAGVLPEDLKVAAGRNFVDLIGQPLKVTRLGGDPTAASMSKITIGERVYIPTEGALAITRAFQLPEKFTGVTGTFEGMLQEVKLGDTDDPNNKGDQPIGQPVKASGTFTSPVFGVKYEQM